MLIGTLLLVASVTAPLPGPAAPSTLIAAQSPEGSKETATVCPVCGKTIQEGQGTKVTVRGREYTVFDAECAEALRSNPDKYLESDGTPKNAKK